MKVIEKKIITNKVSNSKRYVYLGVFLYVILVLFNINQIFGQISFSGVAREMPSNNTYLLNMWEITDLNREPLPEWGIKAIINEPGGYVRLKVQTVPKLNGFNPLSREPHTILYIQNQEQTSSYVHTPGYIYQRQGDVLDEDLAINLFDENINNRYFTFFEDVNNHAFWQSDDYYRGIYRAYQYAKDVNEVTNSTTVLIDNFLEVRFVIEIKDATLQSILLPGIGTIITDPTMFGRSIIAKVTSRNGSVREYVFSEFENEDAETVTDNEIIYGQNSAVDNNVNYTVNTVAGDEVEYTVIGMISDKDPILKGIPKIHPITFAAQRQFLTIPDFGPNQYYPYMAFDAQTHFRLINTYPEKFVVKSEDWNETEYASKNKKSWTWTAQRRTDPALEQYKPNTYYPKVRSGQRESQALGWAAQFLHYYKEYQTDPTSVPKYITGFDIDDWLIPENDIALTAYNFTELDGETKNQNWQHMWGEERYNNIIPTLNENDIIVNSPLGGGNYPLVWDGERGFPKAGFTTNDMITFYQKHKTTLDNNNDTDLQEDYYFNGYEIEDLGTHYVNETASPSQFTSALERDQTNNKPVPCDFDCWYNANYSTGNTKHPGVVSVIFDEGTDSPLKITFRQKVVSPIEDASANPEDGFFGSLEGDQWPMGYGNESTYTLKGVKQVDYDDDRISLCMLEYRDGAMVPTQVLQKDDLTYDAQAKQLSGTFKIYSSWMALAAYYKTPKGPNFFQKPRDSVIIAGRVPMVMDPLTSITIPGSNPLPYDNKSLAQDNSLTPNFFNNPDGWINQQINNAISGITDNPDLIEGQGDRSFETMNEFRIAPDIPRGYSYPNGAAYSKSYVREYVLNKNSQVTFSCIGPGRKIQSFWTTNPDEKREDPYQSWRELARRMPQDIVGQRVNWSVYKIDPDTGDRMPSEIATSTVRHFIYNFDTVGEYEVEILFNGDTENPTKALVKVNQFDPKAVSTSYDDLNFSVERGEIELYLLNEDETLWLLEYGADPNSLDDIRVLEIADLASYYAYALAPRANEYQHREGAFNDMNYEFQWSVADKTFNVPDSFNPIDYPIDVESLVNVTSADNFINNFVQESVWPASWSGIWVNHIPGKATDDELVNFTRYFEGNPSQASEVEQYIGNTFNALTEAQSVLGYIRWYPWIAKSPSEGYKFNRYVKTTLNLPDFFNNGGMGVFSGQAYLDIGNVSNAVSSMDWYDYGSPEAQRPGAEELERHLADEFKNKLEFYNDLKAGRKMIVDINSIIDKKVVALNFNPFLGAGEVNSGRPDLDIYVAGRVIEEQPVENEVSVVSGIPLLTLSGARLDMVNDLNGLYTITSTPNDNEKPTYKIIHNGFDRFLEFTVPNLIDGEQGIDLKVDLPVGLATEENASVYGVALSATSNLSNGNFNISAYYVNDAGTDIQIGSELPVPDRAGSDLMFHVNTPINTDKIKFNISRSVDFAPLSEEILHIDDVRLLKEDINYTFNKPNFISNDVTIRNNSLKWLSTSAYRFFDWNYLDVLDGKGVFLESADENKVSLSGLGMGIAVTILSKEDGRISEAVAKDRIHRVLKWIDGLNKNNILFNGEKGWHGMPSHYYEIDGNLLDGNLDISTVDWAICAQGIRLAREYYSNDTAIGNLCTTLLMRVDWSKFVVPTYIPKIDDTTGEEIPDVTKEIYQDLRGRIVLKGDFRYETQAKIDSLMGIGKLTVLRNRGRIALNVNKESGRVPIAGNAWGQAFSEEAELLYMEVLASNYEKSDIGMAQEEVVDIDINSVVYIDRSPFEDENGNPQQKDEPHKIIYRKNKFGFIPNVNGSGFTYNWLQLWMGNYKITQDNPQNESYSSFNTKYFDNSIAGYTADYNTAISTFGDNYMGLTAASTVSRIQPNGFIKYGDYLGKQGSDKNLSPAGEVVQLAPAPYGAALALPFTQNVALSALQSYVDLGYYHEYIGLPDNIVLRNIGSKKPLPNWEQLDINIAPIAMSIDHITDNVISSILLGDIYQRSAYIELYSSFETDWESTPIVVTQRVSSSEGRKDEDVSNNSLETSDTNLLVYPNPSEDGRFTVKFMLTADSPTHLSVTDIFGRVVYQESKNLSTGNYQVILSNQNMTSTGVYLLTFQTNKVKEVRRLVIKQ